MLKLDFLTVVQPIGLFGSMSLTWKKGTQIFWLNNSAVHWSDFCLWLSRPQTKKGTLVLSQQLAFWEDDTECTGRVKDGWSTQHQGSHMFRLHLKLKASGEILWDWSKRKFCWWISRMQGYRKLPTISAVWRIDDIWGKRREVLGNSVQARMVAVGWPKFRVLSCFYCPTKR